MPKGLEDIIRTVHGVDNEPSRNRNGDVYAELRDELPAEICPLCERYEQRACPTIERMETECASLAHELTLLAEQETGDERAYLLNTSRFINARSAFIKNCSYDYVDTIGQMASLQKRQQYMEEETWRDQLITIDTTRSQRHNALIEALRGLTAKVLELVEEGYLNKEDVTLWNGWHDDVRNRTSKITVFSPKIVTDAHRKIIQDWAISADIMDSLARIKKTQDE